MARRLRTGTAWRIPPEQRGTLRRLLAAVPGDVDETDPRFLALLGAWEAAGKRWNVRPTVEAYDTFSGDWVVSAVPAVLSQIKAHLEAGS